MKYIAIFLILSSGLISFSQDWKPLVKGKKYNYESNFNNNIYTLWIDSLEVINSDTIYYLNRTLEVCDTCSNITEGINCDSCYILDNQPQFLQNAMVDLGNGVMYFKDPLKFVIQTYAKDLDSWLFDTSANIYAQVINSEDLTIFNTIDSIKTILLSTDDTIILSKDFGIIKFAYPFQSGLSYNLAGLQGTDYGLQIPDFSVIYDFNVGDVFQYDIIDYGEGMYLYSDKFKYKILSKQFAQDTLIYTIEGIIYRLDWKLYPYQDPYLFYVLKDIKYFNNLKAFVNRYHHEKLNLADEGLYLTVWDEPLYSYLDVIKSGSTIIKRITSFKDSTYRRLFSKLDDYPDLLNVIDYYDEPVFGLVYEPYLGATTYAFGDAWGLYHKILEGYIKDGDTTGHINSYIISNINDMTKSEIFIYPNPTKGYLYFKLLYYYIIFPYL